VKIIYRIVAECDPPPREDYMQMHGDELDAELEDAVASFLLSAGAGFAIEVAALVEL